MFSTSVQFAFRLTTYLHGLASICDHLSRLWSSSNSYAIRRKIFTVWPPNASRHKLIASQLYMRETDDFRDLRAALRAALRIRLATHRKSVRKFWCLQTCVALQRLASPFGQGFTENGRACIPD